MNDKSCTEIIAEGTRDRVVGYLTSLSLATII